MKIEILAPMQQKDYEEGCISLIPETMEEAFELGMKFERLCDSNIKTVRFAESVRIPLVMEDVL